MSSPNYFTRPRFVNQDSFSCADAFLQGMITNLDRHAGMTGMAIGGMMPFPESTLITMFRMNLLNVFQLRSVYMGNLSVKALCAMRESQLRSLTLGQC